MATKEFADYLNLHLFTIHKYTCQGKVPAFNIGVDWRFHLEYIERWIKQKIYSHINQKSIKILGF